MKTSILNQIKEIDIIGGQILSRAEDNKSKGECELVNILSPKDISNGILADKINSSYLRKDRLNDKKFTKVGDIVLKLSTPYEAIMIDDKHANMLVSSFCAIIRKKDKLGINLKYLLAYLNSEFCRKEYELLLAGSRIGMLSTGKLRSLKVYMPILDNQNIIGNNYIEMIKKRTLYEKIINLEKERFNSELYEIMEDKNE